jgi:WbqC-like protein
LALTISIHQPAYLPWLGYFDRIAKSDLFVVLDTVQFERNSFINRNRIKTSTGTQWLTVPVRLSGHLASTIKDVEIDGRHPWRKKHLRSIAQNYQTARGFAEKLARLATLYDSETDLLAEVCAEHLQFWLREMGIATPIVSASAIGVTGRKSELVLALCRHLGATEYLSGPLGRGYLCEGAFAAAGIRLRYHEYNPPSYPQLHGEFLPSLSVVDYWMNCAEPDLFRAVP